MNWNTANILFADVKGYSSLDDDQMKVFAEVVLKEIANRLTVVTIKEKNTWGDGIVLVCDRIEDACEAALHMRDLFQTFNWKRCNLPKLDVRISVHHGEYLAGEDPFTGRTTFCGRTVVTAARIEPVTPPGKIWITAGAATLLRQRLNDDDNDYFALDDVGEIVLPKKYGKIDIFALRRRNEERLSAGDLAQIREAERMRLDVGGVIDRDKDIRDLVKRDEVKNFSVVIGVVINGGKVLLVKRNNVSEGLVWIFPSAKKWPNEDEVSVIEKEVMQEAGILCSVVDKISEVQCHPVTGFRCVYFSMLPYDDTELENGDPMENAEVEWVDIPEAIARIGASINQEVVAFLRKQAG